MDKKPQRKLTIIPVTLPVANTYIEKWHRHHAPLTTVMKSGAIRANKGNVWFCIAVIAEDELFSENEIHGVAIAGRPMNRNSDDGQTIEVIRLATDGEPNACSALLGAVVRTAREMGAYRVITYTLETESGTSLRAAGFNEDRRGISSCWLKGKGKAVKGGAGNSVWREHMNVKKVGWSKVIRAIIPIVIEREFSYSGPDKRKHAVRPSDESLPRDASVVQPHGTAPLLEPGE